MSQSNPFQPIVGVAGKKYGLIVKAKPSALFSADDDTETQPVNASYIQQVSKAKADKKAQETVSKALAEDPTIFDYDGVVDAIQEKRTETSNQKQLQSQRREPKYIKALLDRAEIRKKEDRVVFDRKLKKEREEDEAEHGDKEKFVTQAYLDQLEADRLWREEEAKKAADEERNDVTKKGMSNFYRNLFSTDNVATGGGPRDFSTRSQSQPRTPAPPASQPSSSSASSAPKTERRSPVRDERSPPSVPKRERTPESDSRDSKRPKENSTTASAPPTVAPVAPPTAPAATAPPPAAPAKPAAPKLDDAAVQAARERYLARKKQAQP